MSKYSDTLSQMSKHVRAFLFSRDALAFLFFVFLAACMWYAHALGSVRDLTLHVPITYVGLPKDMDNTLPDHLDITLRDAGRRLLTQQQELPSLEFDVRNQVNGSNGTIHISTEQIMQKLPTTLQGGGTAKIRSIEPETIDGTYSERFTERVFKMPIQTKDVPRGYTLRTFPTEVEVVVRVSMTHYQQVSEKNLSVYCNYPKDGEEHLKVQVENKSRYMSNIRVTPAEVEYIIETGRP